jgi:hypothetical protein
VGLYESRVLPLLKADADLKLIRPLDDEMDKYVTAINDALTPFATVLTQEADEADKLFDATCARIISGSLVTAVVMLAALIVFSLYVSRGIIRQLGESHITRWKFPAASPLAIFLPVWKSPVPVRTA